MPPLVLIHGVPESARVWDDLIPSLRPLGREPVLLSPPGLGAPLPDDFPPTPGGYLEWLARSLERFGEPVDIVGHDWGGGLAVMLAMQRPELVRTWASDAVGVFHVEYVWHQFAQLWQTPAAGEQWVAGTLGDPARWTAGLGRAGMAPATAQVVGPAFDAAMGRAILSLYRAAVQPAVAELGAGLAAAAQRPGLAIIAAADTTVGTLAQRREAARTAGAAVVELAGAGHWWMTQGEHTTVIEALSELWTHRWRSPPLNPGDHSVDD